MTSVLQRIIETHGGMETWNSAASLDAIVSIGGALFPLKHLSRLERVRVSINTRRPEVTLHEYPVPGQSCVFLGDARVEVRRADGSVLEARDTPRTYFSRARRLISWDLLDFTYFCGYAMWNYLTMPFLLLQQGVSVTERVSNTGGTVLDVTFPSGLPTHCAQQAFHFNDAGLLVKHEYTAEVVGSWASVSHECSAHRPFSGVMFPTCRRVYPILLGAVRRAVTVVAIDVFDMELRSAE